MSTLREKRKKEDSGIWQQVRKQSPLCYAFSKIFMKTMIFFESEM